MIKFSIVTITFNAEGALPRTLESVLRQGYPAIEHLIVDGASADGTLGVAEDYKRRSDSAANGHAVAISSEPDRGLYDAMNKGLARATGDYVCFLNAGDYLPDTDTIGLLARTAASAVAAGGELPAVIYGDTDIVDDAGRYLGPRRLRPPRNLSWRSFRHGMLVCHQAFYARTDIARRTPYDLKYKYSADVDWCIRVMKEAARQRLPLANARATIACYTQEGQTTLHHRESLRERFSVMACHYGVAPTTIMHAWFAVRELLRRFRPRAGRQRS